MTNRTYISLLLGILWTSIFRVPWYLNVLNHFVNDLKNGELVPFYVFFQFGHELHLRLQNGAIENHVFPRTKICVSTTLEKVAHLP